MSTKNYITQSRLKKVLHYCPDTGVFTWIERKIGRRMSVPAGSKSAGGYLRIMINGLSYYSHRLAWFYVNGVWPEEIDHINHSRADNRICNLRAITRNENVKNASLRRDNPSGYTGIRWINSTEKWQAYIGLNRKFKSLGHYVSMTDAITARKAAEIKYGFHGNHGQITANLVK